MMKITPENLEFIINFDKKMQLYFANGYNDQKILTSMALELPTIMMIRNSTHVCAFYTFVQGGPNYVKNMMVFIIT